MQLILYTSFSRIRRILLPLAWYYSMSPRLKYIPFPSLFVHTSLFPIIAIYYYLIPFSFLACLFIFFFCFNILSLGWSRTHSVYHPTGEKAPTTTGTSIEGFFDGADAVAEAMASASIATTQKALTEALVPPFEHVSAEESTHVERVIIGESVPIPTKIPTP